VDDQGPGELSHRRSPTRGRLGCGPLPGDRQ
jgi:hypothetical protein